MSEEKITEALGELRKEGEQLDSPEARERLTSLVDNIEQNIDLTGFGEEHQDVIEDIQDAITHFEVEHPHITGILHEIMMALNNMGI